MVWDSHKIRESSCIACGKKLNGACTETGVMPTPGDVTICIACGHIMAFADDLALRELTSDEMHEIAGDKQILRIQAALAQVKRR